MPLLKHGNIVLVLIGFGTYRACTCLTTRHIFLSSTSHDRACVLVPVHVTVKSKTNIKSMSSALDKWSGGTVICIAVSRDER